MKHIIFILSLSIAVLLVTGALFFSKSSTSQPALSANALLHTIAVSASGSNSDVRIYSGPEDGLSLADAVYTDKNSVLAIQTGATQKIKFTSGVALLALENQFTPVQIVTPRLTIDHRSKGLYYVDIRSGSTRVYSLTAMLKIVIRDADSTEITSFTLLPSQYFVFDEGIDSDSMRWADIFRISQLQTLAIAPVKSSESYQKVFGTQASMAKKLFEKMSSERVRARDSLTQFRQSLKEPTSDTLQLLEKYGSFFVNDQKKISIYQSLLAQKLQKLLVLGQTDCALSCQKEITAFKKVVGEITSIKSSLITFPWVNKDAVDTLMNDYTLLLSLEVIGKNQVFFNTVQKVLIQFWKESDPSFSNQWVYIPFSELYARHIFGDLTEAGIAEDFQKALGVLIDSGQLPEVEFSGFVFFLKDYLGSSALAGASQIILFKQFIQIAKSYVPTIRDTQKRSAILSLFYYSIWGVGKHLTELITQEYFTSETLQDTELKPQFIISWSPNIPAELVGALKDFREVYDAFDATFKDEFQSILTTNSADTVDSRSIANKAFADIWSVYFIFTKYAEYRTDISLSEAAKKATGLEAKKEPLNLTSLVQYLSGFSGVDTQSIGITNDIDVDAFYQVTAKIYGRDFSFRLNPQGNIIEKIIITDWFTENREYERISLSIDDRAKDLNEKLTSATSSEERAQFDIKNFFKYTFSNTPWSAPSTVTPVPSETPFNLTPQMKLFVQSELIEKDFFLLKDVLTVPITRVNAQIEGGEYKIQLRNVTSSVSSNNRSFAIQINSDYLFSKDIHAFSNIEFTVKNEQGIDYFGGSTITLLPRQIPTQEFAKRWAELPSYLARMTNLVNTKSTISIDLDARVLTINGESISL
jgi:hypothetical protein